MSFSVHMPASHYGQTSPAWGAGSIIRVNIEKKQPTQGDQLVYNEMDNIWEIRKPEFQIAISPKPSSTPNLPYIVYNPSTSQLLYTSNHYATLISSQEQKVPQSQIYMYTYTSMPFSTGILFDPADPTKVRFTQVGVYKVGTSIIFRQTNSSGDVVYFGFYLNGEPIEHSGTDVYIHTAHASIPAYAEMILPITNTTDHIQIVAYTTSNRVYSPYIASPSAGMPDVPSIITTIQQCV